MPALVWALVIFTASSIPRIKLPRLKFIPADKVAHFAIFFILGYLMYRFFEPTEKSTTINWKRFIVSSLITISYGVVDEVHQLYVPGRQFDTNDMITDAIGAIFAMCVVYFITKHQLKKVN